MVEASQSAAYRATDGTGRGGFNLGWLLQAVAGAACFFLFGFSYAALGPVAPQEMFVPWLFLLGQTLGSFVVAVVPRFNVRQPRTIAHCAAYCCVIPVMLSLAFVTGCGGGCQTDVAVPPMAAVAAFDGAVLGMVLAGVVRRAVSPRESGVGNLSLRMAMAGVIAGAVMLVAAGAFEVQAARASSGGVDLFENFRALTATGNNWTIAALIGWWLGGSLLVLGLLAAGHESRRRRAAVA